MRPFALIADGPTPGRQRWLRFDRPVEVLRADALADVRPCVAAVEAAVEGGRWAVGFLAYEAAPAFDPALVAHPPRCHPDGRPWPLAWWALCPQPREFAAPPGVLPVGVRGELPTLDWRPGTSVAHYLEAIAAIRERIAAGDTYQVNYTYPLEASFAGDAWAFFAALVAAQRGAYAAFLDCGLAEGDPEGGLAVLSASPELFVARDGDALRTRPMKGTSRRGRWPAEDAAARAELLSAKNRAENVMIVDMLRNDLGKIAVPGSVQVAELFAVETYPTVHQLASEVRARSEVSQLELLTSLFPCASITGAPKASTMRLIRELEADPRGLYTGAMGYWAPGRRLALNVAIRTVVVDREAQRAHFGTGGGVVWDSEAEDELREARTKALLLTRARPPFSLLETMAWRRRTGIVLLERHLERMAASAGYFGIPFDRPTVEEALRTAIAAHAEQLAAPRLRLRLLVAEDGTPTVEVAELACQRRTPLRVALDDRPVDSDDVFLFHKTTRRSVYQQAMARHPQADEVLLWNERGHLTEGTRHNLVVRLDDAEWTPPVADGLLAGTYRHELLARGRLRERSLRVADLAAAEAVYLINSVQGWRRVESLPLPAGGLSSGPDQQSPPSLQDVGRSQPEPAISIE
jgi:para-aminobenzoate synthetase/4-amino-4-deoxychorismate lyase